MSELIHLTKQYGGSRLARLVTSGLVEVSVFAGEPSGEYVAYLEGRLPVAAEQALIDRWNRQEESHLVLRGDRIVLQHYILPGDVPEDEVRVFLDDLYRLVRILAGEKEGRQAWRGAEA